MAAINKVFYLIPLLVSGILFSQSVISGKVIDGDFNDPLPFANISLRSSGDNNLDGSSSDFDGNYSFEVSEGTYILEFSFVGYGTKIINDIQVGNSEEVTIDVVLISASNDLEEVVVSVSARANNEVAVLAIQKRAVNLLDGLSSQSISKSGDTNIAAAIKRVPGVSVQGGKFVYVRGLGDRYSKTLLGGLEVPGLDPDRNTLQLDVFPTNLLDNIIVNKSASANMNADFTGGIVNIILKDFSVKPEYGISISSSFNDQMSFKTAPGLQKESLSFLKFDTGYNELPFLTNTKIIVPETFLSIPVAQEVTDITNSFSKPLAVSRYNNFTDFSIGGTASNQYNFGENNSIGYIAALNYRYDADYYKNMFNGSVLKETSGLTQNTVQEGELGQVQALASVLFGIAFKTRKTKHKITFLHLKSGESAALDVRLAEFLENTYEGQGNLMTHTERNITSIPISGVYNLRDNKIVVDWKVAPSFVRVYDKDFRKTVFEKVGDRLLLNSGIMWPTRLWRNLEEDALASNLNMTLNYKLNGLDNKLRIGAGFATKNRDFTTNNYSLGFIGSSPILGGDPNQILNTNNVWTLADPKGTYTIGSYQRTNQYEAGSKTIAFYISNEFKITNSFKSVFGVRFEQYNTLYTGETVDYIIYDKEEFIDVGDIYPSINLINSIDDNTNLRFSYSKTTARPSFKEISGAQIYDPVTERNFLGNPNLLPTYIDNLDLRYERFGIGNQIFAISAFYKIFDNPIEILFPNFNSPNILQASNNDSAKVYGVEFEYRKDFINNDINKLSLNMNTSIIRSRQKMNDSEYSGRQITEPDRDIDQYREMQGQSPFIINTGLIYSSLDKNIEVGAYYNVQGKTLQVVGVGNIPDVYTDPFNSLKLNATKTFGKNNSQSITFKIDNLLGDKRESRYNYFGNTEYLFSQLDPGRTFSLGYSFRF